MNSTPNSSRQSWHLVAADLLLPLLIALPVLWVLLPGGLPSTADNQVHFMRAAEMVHAWQDGVLLPRWSANLGLGLGIPLFVYAPPLPYFVTAGLHWLGLPLDVAYKGMWMIALLICAFGGYRLPRNMLGMWPAVVSCAVLVFAPLGLRELFIQGNAGQYMAWAFLPWLCWGVLQSYRQVGLGMVIATGLAMAGVLLSHNAVALLAAGMAGGLWLCLAVGTRQWRASLRSLAGIGLGLLLSAWFWAPALLEVGYMRADLIAASDFHPRFIGLSELLALSPRLDRGAINPYFPMTLGAVQAALGAIGICATVLLFVANRRSRGRIPDPQSPISNPFLLPASLFFSIAALFGAFMALAWSEPLWRVLPFLDLFEFPWRWHGMTSVALAWLAGLVIFMVGVWRPRLTMLFGGGALLLLIGSSLVNLYPHKLEPGAYAASPVDVVRYELKTGQIGTTSLGEFNPRWAPTAFKGSPLVDDYLAGSAPNRLPADLPPGLTARPIESSVQEHRFQINASQPATLTFDLHYFPGWQATSNGQALGVAPHPGSGWIDVALPAGEQTLTLRFGATPLRRTAEIISLVTLAALVMLLIWRRTRTRSDDFSRQHSTTAVITADGTLLIVGALITGLLIVSALFARQITITSPPDQALLATVPLRADFGDQLRVLGVDLPPELVDPGEAISAAVYLRALQPLLHNYSIFLHLDRPDGVTVASIDALHPGDIPTTHWPTGLYVRSPLRINAPDGLPPMRYRLRVGIVEPESGEWLALAGDQGDVLEIGEVWLEGAPAQPPAGPQARFGDAIHLLGAQIDAATSTLHLFWRADADIVADFIVFVHLLDAQGNVLGQVDGVPFDNQYPTSAWRPGQVIEDVRSIALDNAPDNAPGEVAQIVIGLYDPVSGERLAAKNGSGDALPNNALVIPVGE
jgi:hypothetical protein